MALATLTPQQRLAALEKAAEARKVRADVKANLKSGKKKLSQVLKMADKDPVVAKLKVSSTLMALPGIGEVKSKALMEQIGIAPSRRLGGLGKHQRQALIDLFG